MKVSACALSLCLAAGAGSAAELYRCVTLEGAVAYQDAPCGAGTATSRKIELAPTPRGHVPEKPSNARVASGRTAVHRRPASAVPDARSRQRTSCAKARADREAALERAGLRRTFEQLRALDDRVYAACKGL